MKKLPFLISIFCIQSSIAIEYNINEAVLHVDARDMALGGLVCSMEEVSERTLECSYLIPYQLKELSNRTILFKTRKVGLDWSIGWHQSGDADWMENYWGLHLEKRLNARLNIGVEFNILLQQDISGTNASAIFSQVQCRYALTEKTSLALLFINPGGARMNTSYGKVPLSISSFLAVRYIPARKCLLYGEIGGWTNQSVKGRLGFEYILSDLLAIRTGFSTNPILPCWGVGGKFHRFNYSLGGNLHPILGMSKGFSLQYTW